MRIGTELSSFTPAFLKSSAVYVISTLVSVVVSEVAVVSVVSVTTGSVVASEVSSAFLQPARSEAVTAAVRINAVSFLIFILSLSVYL